ncbi:MAG: IS4 family transposase, partial [Deltaproteobacteria bacterium]|nr:IS4 family transposase [Deltaproteobacteria bacterium]
CWTWFGSLLNKQGTYFVTRAKDNMQFKVVESRPTDRTQGLICDQIIYLKTYRGRDYEGKLRRIKYREPDTNKVLVFITNRFDLATKTICDLYKARWKVENFFKTMKQYLKIKKYLGTSENSVKAQVLTSLIAYLLIQILKFGFRTHLSTPDIMAVIGTLILHKQPLAPLLGDLPCTTRYSPMLQLPLGI